MIDVYIMFRVSFINTKLMIYWGTSLPWFLFVKSLFTTPRHSGAVEDLACGEESLYGHISIYAFLACSWVTWGSCLLIPKWVCKRLSPRTKCVHKGHEKDLWGLWMMSVVVERVAERGELHRTQRLGPMPSCWGFTFTCIEYSVPEKLRLRQILQPDCVLKLGNMEPGLCSTSAYLICLCTLLKAFLTDCTWKCPVPSWNTLSK